VRRITISIPDELANALAREAKRRSVPASALARDALSEYLDIPQTNERRELPFAALGASGHNTTARDVDDLLEREWAPEARDG